MKMILAALDFSDATPGVVEEAANLAQAFEGYVVLLHVTRIPVMMPRDVAEMTCLAEAQAAIVAAANRQLFDIKERLRERGVTTQLLRLTGDPKRDIAYQAKKLAADYIVMGSHGHTALYDLVIGSTTSAVIKRSNRVVVVVPRPNKAKKVPLIEAAASAAADGRTRK